MEKHESICKAEPKKPVPIKSDKPDRQPLERVDRPLKQPAAKQSDKPSVKVERLPHIEEHNSPLLQKEPAAVKDMAKLLAGLKHKKKSPNEI